MKNRLSALVLLSVIVIAALAGCAENPNTNTTDAPTLAITETTVSETTVSETTTSPTTEAIAATEPSEVSATFAKDTDFDLTNAQRFTADNSEYEQEIVFFAKFGDVSDFKFCSINWLDETDGGESNIEFVPMYTTDALTTDTPLVVTMTFWGDIPSYGIIYTDSEGVEHSGTIYTNGMDGSIVLDVI